MKIAVVILNWNGKKLLEQFLPSVLKYSENKADIYIADNASTDASVSYVKNTFPQIHIVQNKENGGFAKGYNDALQHIEADIYALVNSDIEVTEGWLDPIIKQFSEEANTAVIQPKILDYKEKDLFEYAGAGGGFMDKYGYPFCRGRIFDTVEKDKGQYNDITDIFWATGACFFVRSSVFHELNGFDTDFFAHMEEIDLCWRIQNKGYKIQYVGSATVYHVGAATLQQVSPQKTYLNFRNSLYTLAKNLPSHLLFSVIFTHLILDGIAGVRFLIQVKPLHTLSIIKAHFHFYGNLSRTLKKRTKTGTFLKNYYKAKSIVWSYFVLNKKNFTDL